MINSLPEAEADLIRLIEAWRETRQPIMGTRAAIAKHELHERELHFQLTNAAMLWLWFKEKSHDATGSQSLVGDDDEIKRDPSPF